MKVLVFVSLVYVAVVAGGAVFDPNPTITFSTESPQKGGDINIKCQYPTITFSTESPQKGGDVNIKCQCKAYKEKLGTSMSLANECGGCMDIAVVSYDPKATGDKVKGVAIPEDRQTANYKMEGENLVIDIDYKNLKCDDVINYKCDCNYKYYPEEVNKKEVTRTLAIGGC